LNETQAPKCSQNHLREQMDPSLKPQIEWPIRLLTQAVSDFIGLKKRPA